MKKKESVDLIRGSIAKSIIWFSIPLLIGNLFQQLYNTVDSYVVGNYVSKQALAAVGASSPIINMLIGFFMGLATGAGVVIAQYYGAEDHNRLKKAVHSSAALTIAMALLLTVVGILGTNPMLRAVGIPADVFPESSTYLKIYFLGISFTLIYNMGSGILRAIGDSKRPLYFFGEAFIAFFNSEIDVVKAGRTMQMAFIPFYILLPFNNVYGGVLRGAGKSAVPMYIMVFNFVILRQIYLAIITKLTSSVYYVFMGWPVTWITCTIMFIIYYHKVKWLPEEVE